MLSADILWLLGPALQVVLVVVMQRAKLARQFPFFFAYTLFEIVSNIVLFSLYRGLYGKAYFYTFWLCRALGILMGFAVLREVFAFALRPYTGLRDLGMMMFRWAAFLLILISGIMAGSGASSQLASITKTLVNLELSMGIMQCGLLMFMFLCASSLGLSWSTPAFGIALGFGISAASELTVSSLKAHLGTPWDVSLNLIGSCAFDVAVLLWLAYMLMPEPRRKTGKVIYQPMFDRWNQAAMLVLNQGNAQAPALDQPSYLSDLERTVATVMAGNGRRPLEDSPAKGDGRAEGMGSREGEKFALSGLFSGGR